MTASVVMAGTSKASLPLKSNMINRVPLGEIVEFLDHKRRPITSKDRIAGPIPYYGANGQQDSVSDYIFDEPLVLLAEDGGHFDDPARGIAYRISGKAWVNNHAHVLRPTRRVDINYLGRALENFDVRSFLTGSTRAKLTKAGAQRISIPLPSLEEQRRIAAILDKADELRTKRRQALAQLNNLTQSIFNTVFGDMRESPKVAFDELCRGDFRNGVSPSTRGLVQQRVLTLSAVTGEAFDAGLSKIGMFDRNTPIGQRVASSSLLICRGNGNLNLVGRGHFPPMDHPDLVFPDTVIAAKPDLSRVTRAFLGYVWNSPEIRSQLENRARTTNGTFKVNQSMLGEILLPEPPISRQNVFSEQVAVIDRLRARHRVQFDELNALFGSLQHRAFRGQL